MKAPCNHHATEVQFGPEPARTLDMTVVASWTGARADALRQALRMSIEDFAGHLGVAARTVSYWRERPDAPLRPVTQQLLDVALARAPEQARAQFALLLAEREHGQAPTLTGARIAVSDDVASLTAWITSTNISDEAIEHIEQATAVLADQHTQLHARCVLADVLQLHGKTQTLLRSGKQRLRQTRDLIRIDSDLLAHASVLLGDLGQDQAARAYGNAALLGTQEADTSPARACYALAKTARWQHRYGDAADLARYGCQDGPVTPMSVQLAYYEANAAALAGDTARAKTALARADMFADTPSGLDAGTSPWSFSPERQAMFALSVALCTGNADGALRAALAADQGWAAGDPHIPGTWAQVRIGAAIAHLLKDVLDGAVEQVTPMLTMPPEYRIATVTGWLADLDRRLASHLYVSSQAASGLRQQIRDFTTSALPPHVTREAG
jgi:DNA-binding transcriptional regulator YiaG